MILKFEAYCMVKTSEHRKLPTIPNGDFESSKLGMFEPTFSFSCLLSKYLVED